jgi:hypothetical protein
MRILTDDDIQTEKIARANILRLMLDFQWHQTMEIIQVSGGSEGMRRLRELRQHYEIERNRVIGSRQWQYRLVPELQYRLVPEFV